MEKKQKAHEHHTTHAEQRSINIKKSPHIQ